MMPLFAHLHFIAAHNFLQHFMQRKTNAFALVYWHKSRGLNRAEGKLSLAVTTHGAESEDAMLLRVCTLEHA